MEGNERGAVREGPKQTLAPKAHGRRRRSKKPSLGYRTTFTTLSEASRCQLATGNQSSSVLCVTTTWKKFSRPRT